MSDGFDMGKFISETADTHRWLMQHGIEIGEGRYRSAIRALDVAYRKAALDPETKIAKELPNHLITCPSHGLAGTPCWSPLSGSLDHTK